MFLIYLLKELNILSIVIFFKKNLYNSFVSSEKSMFSNSLNFTIGPREPSYRSLEGDCFQFLSLSTAYLSDDLLMLEREHSVNVTFYICILNQRRQFKENMKEKRSIQVVLT